MADDFSQAHVLIADDAPTVRQSLRMTLAQCGINRVDAASSIGETRRRLRNAQYDVVLCDYHFGEGMNGQELLEELRQSSELPLYTIWIMITAEAAYEKVVAVAEIGPDDYLIKPFTSALLTQRLSLAWKRKRFLKPIYDKINEDDISGAITAAKELIPKAEGFRSDLMRLLSSLLLEAGQLEQARLLFEEILSQRMIPWAKLGLAKALVRQGKKNQAEGALQAAIVEHAQYVDAYEELASMYMADGRLDQAMAVFEKCLAMTPNNVSRLQKAGNLANMLGDSAKAKKLLEQAVKCGGNSAALSADTVLQLALAARRENNSSDAEKYLRLVKEIAKKEHSVKNKIIDLIATAIYEGKPQLLNQIEVHLSDAEMTQEIATSFIMAADLICPATVEGETPKGDAPPYKWLRQISQRFITTRHISGLLESAANLRPTWKEYILQVGQEINELNNTGVQLMLKSAFTEAIDLLLPAAQSTCNNRLMLSTSHAIVKYLKTQPDIDKKQRNALITVASGMIERLRGLIDAGTQHSLSQDLQQLFDS
ncbi:tetratricopeptide repeat-containing response regulator [uncultured Deefgea sp.]|uniref:tetratricopeptide repeat-containing response regulator n=1 Tax=uncultured Deefgea sp. TaxID=1304914 RepID=UPI00260EE453|nr:tetratricopeptide repeat-containing response regulator [uncultured Deefgea sp.]